MAGLRWHYRLVRGGGKDLAMSAVQTESRETPRDGYGIGFVSYRLRTEFRDLCKLAGLDAAQDIMAEIILDERRRRCSS